MYIPLEFDPGSDAQVDWGEAVVIIEGEKTSGSLVSNSQYGPMLVREQLKWGRIRRLLPSMEPNGAAKCRLIFHIENCWSLVMTIAILNEACIMTGTVGSILLGRSLGMTRRKKDPLNPQSRHAEALLEIVRATLDTDTAYVARLESHYQQVKQAAADPVNLHSCGI